MREQDINAFGRFLTRDDILAALALLAAGPGVQFEIKLAYSPRSVYIVSYYNYIK